MGSASAAQLKSRACGRWQVTGGSCPASPLSRTAYQGHLPGCGPWPSRSGRRKLGFQSHFHPLALMQGSSRKQQLSSAVSTQPARRPLHPARRPPHPASCTASVKTRPVEVSGCGPRPKEERALSKPRSTSFVLALSATESVSNVRARSAQLASLLRCRFPGTTWVSLERTQHLSSTHIQEGFSSRKS